MPISDAKVGHNNGLHLRNTLQPALEIQTLQTLDLWQRAASDIRSLIALTTCFDNISEPHLNEMWSCYWLLEMRTKTVCSTPTSDLWKFPCLFLTTKERNRSIRKMLEIYQHRSFGFWVSVEKTQTCDTSSTGTATCMRTINIWSCLRHWMWHLVHEVTRVVYFSNTLYKSIMSDIISWDACHMKIIIRFWIKEVNKYEQLWNWDCQVW